MAPSLSKRADRIVQAEIRAMSIECERVNGINLAQGVCDTEVPAVVRVAAVEAMESGLNSYTRFDGIARLRYAIAEKMMSYNRISADPDTQITVSAGATGAFYCACLALLDPGDEVILFQPYYGYHANTLLAVDAKAVYVNLRYPDWSFDPENLDSAVTTRTKGIVINTPANPCGKVFTETELQWIADFAIRHDLIVFTDEIYEYFLYDGRQHVSPASLPQLADRTVTISGFSKSFSITGWRVGYSIARADYARMIGYINDLVYVCAPAPLQFGAAVGLVGLPGEFYTTLSRTYESKRNRLCASLTAAGLRPCVPGGAYYVLADVRSLPGDSSKQKAMYLLNETGVASVPGASFFDGEAGEHLVRFCFAKNDAVLDEACRRLGRINAHPASSVSQYSTVPSGGDGLHNGI